MGGRSDYRGVVDVETGWTTVDLVAEAQYTVPVVAKSMWVLIGYRKAYPMSSLEFCGSRAANRWARTRLILNRP